MPKKRPRIAVVGSCNMDLCVICPELPQAGQTLMGRDFVATPGGKGANQAVAAAKLGAEVNFLTRVGDDTFGAMARDNLERCGVNLGWVLTTEDRPTGVALIYLDEHGRNMIVVAPGANGDLTPEDVEQARAAITSADALLLQLEIPLPTVKAAARLACDHDVPVILDPAPAQVLDAELLGCITIATPNESEAAALTRTPVMDDVSANAAARELMAHGVKGVVVTLGDAGAVAVSDGETTKIEPHRIQAVDSVAAGDAFTGALAVALARGVDFIEAAHFANSVAAVVVTRRGAQEAMPTKDEMQKFLEQLQS